MVQREMRREMRRVGRVRVRVRVRIRVRVSRVGLRHDYLVSDRGQRRRRLHGT